MIIILSCQKFWKITNSTHSPLFEDALITDLPILCGKYYIADARLPICEPLILTRVIATTSQSGAMPNFGMSLIHQVALFG